MTVDSEVQRLSRLVDSLLKLSRLENRANPNKQEIVDVGQVVSGIISTHEAYVAEAGLKLLYKADPDVYVFGENGFNEAAAEQVASINGAFACAGMCFEGTYDIFVSDRALILEEWELDKMGYRKNDKRASKSN